MTPSSSELVGIRRWSASLPDDPIEHHAALENGFTKNAVEVDYGKLYLVCLPEGSTPPREEGGVDGTGVVFCGTDVHVYQHFFADFGPLNLGHMHTFCKKLGRLLELEGSGEGKRRPVYVYCSDHAHRRSNAVVLVLAYAVLYLGKTAEEAYTPFFGLEPPLVPYRDASFGVCTYHLEVLDCVRAIARAASLHHLDLNAFRADEYAFYDKIENGDLNWIIPGKFVAFSGPLASRREVESGKWTLLAEDYVPIFRKLGVTCVIRFNKRCYDRRRFTEGGIKHIDLYYEDGGNPSEEILQRFLRICEDTKGAIAVHCKAGLGRTGTNIALYMMKHYGYTAAEAIALCRICRPGSIVGPQQQFLQDLEHRMKREGELHRRKDRSGARGSGIDRVGPSSGLLSPGRRPRQSYSSVDSGVSVVSGGMKPNAGRRPTTSPLLLRRHSTAGTGGGSGGERATGSTITSRNHAGNRWVSGEDALIVNGGGGGSGNSRGGNNRVCAAWAGGSSGRGQSGLQRPRRRSSPVGRKHTRGAVGGTGDLVENLQLDGRNSSCGAALVTENVGADQGAAAGAAAVGGSLSSAPGRLLPLAASSARPITNQARVSSAVRRAQQRTGIGFPSSPPSARGTEGNASRSSSAVGLVARGSKGRAASAWQNPAGGKVGKGERDGMSSMRVGGPTRVDWTTKVSPYLTATRGRRVGS